MVCNKIKSNITEHHVKELNRKIMMVCDDCHKVITWYYDALPKMKASLKKTKN